MPSSQVDVRVQNKKKTHLSSIPGLEQNRSRIKCYHFSIIPLPHHVSTWPHSHLEVTHITSAPFHWPDLSHMTNLAVEEAGNCNLCFGQTSTVPNTLLLWKKR